MSFGFIALCLQFGVPLDRIPEVYQRFHIDMRNDLITDYEVAVYIEQWWGVQAV